MYWELCWYALSFLTLRDVLKYRLGPLQPDRDALANASYLGALLAFLVSFGLTLKHRWVHGAADIEAEGQLVATHVIVAMHGHFIIRDRRVAPILTLCVAIIALHEALAPTDGALHLVLMIIAAGADLTFPCVLLLDRFPRQVKAAWRSLMALQWMAVVAAISWEIGSAEPQSWLLIPALGLVPWLLPTDNFTSDLATEDMTALAVLDATYSRLSGELDGVYRGPPMLKQSEVVVELLEPPSPTNAKSRRKNKRNAGPHKQ